ncbi:hypothetical protein SALBM217S_07700 [Streptomyces griseoloalbus]
MISGVVLVVSGVGMLSRGDGSGWFGLGFGLVIGGPSLAGVVLQVGEWFSGRSGRDPVVPAQPAEPPRPRRDWGPMGGEPGRRGGLRGSPRSGRMLRWAGGADGTRRHGSSSSRNAGVSSGACAPAAGPRRRLGHTPPPPSQGRLLLPLTVARDPDDEGEGYERQGGQAEGFVRAHRHRGADPAGEQQQPARLRRAAASPAMCSYAATASGFGGTGGTVGESSVRTGRPAPAGPLGGTSGTARVSSR